MEASFGRRTLFHVIRALLLTTAFVLLVLLGEAFSFVPFYEAPGYNPNTSTGYLSPAFRAMTGIGEASQGRLLTEQGTATWGANYSPPGDLNAIRWSPTSGPVERLDVFDEGEGAVPFAIADDERVVGSATTVSGSRAALWSAEQTGLHILQIHSLFISRAAHDINDSGVVVGYGEKFSNGSGYHAVLWDSALIPHALETPVTMIFPDSRTNVQALAVNEASVVVGFGRLAADTGRRAVRWDSARNATVLGHLGSTAGGDTNATAWAINSAGDAVGYAEKYDAMGNYDGERAVRWDATSTSAEELELLGAASTGFSHSHVYDINDAGTSVGFSSIFENDVSPGVVAVRWDAAGQVTELGHLPGGYKLGEAYDINEAGIAVGRAQRPEGFSAEYVAVYWDADGNAVDLNTLIEPDNGWVLRRALAINDAGLILGEGSYTDDPDGPGGPAGTTYGRTFMMQLPLAPELPGDYNDDGTVDAADYVVWRKHLGTNTSLPNDTTPGSVLQVDYAVWQENFGETAGAGSSSVAVPEPTALALVLLSIAALVSQSFSRRSRKSEAKSFRQQVVISMAIKHRRSSPCVYSESSRCSPFCCSSIVVQVMRLRGSWPMPDSKRQACRPA